MTPYNQLLRAFEMLRLVFCLIVPDGFEGTTISVNPATTKAQHNMPYDLHLLQHRCVKIIYPIYTLFSSS